MCGLLSELGLLHQGQHWCNGWCNGFLKEGFFHEVFSMGLFPDMDLSPGWGFHIKDNFFDEFSEEEFLPRGYCPRDFFFYVTSVWISPCEFLSRLGLFVISTASLMKVFAK